MIIKKIINQADQIKTDTTNFDNILSASDDTVQKALDKLDSIESVGLTHSQIMSRVFIGV